MVGDYSIGKVEAVLPGIQAAFGNIGTEKSAFLHASDVADEEVDDEEDDPGNADVPEPDEAPEKAEKGAKGSNGSSKSNGKRNGSKGEPQNQDLLKRGQDIVVQVSKEPISTQGPHVTAQHSLAGRFLVYIPGESKEIGRAHV